MVMTPVVNVGHAGILDVADGFVEPRADGTGLFAISIFSATRR